jgi:hypothetical protein
MQVRWWSIAAGLLLVGLLNGCSSKGSGDGKGQGTGDQRAAGSEQAEEEQAIREARAALKPEDRALVEAQDYCAVMTDKRLGVMGEPFKVMIKDQPVFLCCKGCRRKALAEPDKTLAKVEELKAKRKAGSPQK